jgi:hypothetical protein
MGLESSSGTEIDPSRVSDHLSLSRSSDLGAVRDGGHLILSEDTFSWTLQSGGGHTGLGDNNCSTGRLRFFVLVRLCILAFHGGLSSFPGGARGRLKRGTALASWTSLPAAKPQTGVCVCLGQC